MRKGSRVALWGYNSANWLISFFSIIRAGGTAVLLNYSMSCQDAGELLTMTETGFLLCGNNSEMKTDPDAMRRLGDLAGIPSERCLDIRDGVLSFDPALMEGTKEFDALEARTPSEAGETAFIIFTSGTTSKPKAVQISQKALTFDADAFKEKPRF